MQVTCYEERLIKDQKYQSITEEYCKFIDCSFENCSFEDCTINHCHFVNCSFYNCNIISLILDQELKKAYYSIFISNESNRLTTSGKENFACLNLLEGMSIT